jgi:hypothetical protein
VITRRLLYLDSQRLSAWLWRQGKLTAEGSFENRRDDLARFADYLSAHPGSQFQMLVNVGEEGHQLETIPFLQGKDRAALITRKLGQNFLGTPLATAISLGYEKSKRKNEKLLLTALTNPGHLEPWLACIRETDTALAGCYNLAQLGGLLLKKLGQPPARALLLTYQDHSIRESFLVDGQAHFSRMTPLPDTSIAGTASRFASEAVKLHQYLSGQRLIGRGEKLPVHVVVNPQALNAVRQACVDTPNLGFQIIDSHATAKRLGLKNPSEDISAEQLFLHLLAVAPPRQQLAPESWRHDYRIAQIRTGMWSAGAMILLASALFGIKLTWEAQDFREQTSALTSSETELNWRYREIVATFPKVGTDHDNLRRVTEQADQLRKQQRLPNGTLRSLSQSLSEAPNVHLDQVVWTLNERQVGTGGSAKGAPRLDAVGETVTFDGQVRLGPASTARQALATFEHFVDLLRVDREVEVTVDKQPLEIESGRTLRGADLDDEQSQPRQFSVHVSRKLTP